MPAGQPLKNWEMISVDEDLPTNESLSQSLNPVEKYFPPNEPLILRRELAHPDYPKLHSLCQSVVCDKERLVHVINSLKTGCNDYPNRKSHNDQESQPLGPEVIPILLNFLIRVDP